MLKKYIKSINIGNVCLKNNIFLAPMAGVTDLSFRYICNKYGIGAGVSEMISAKGLIYNDKKTIKLMEMYIGESPKIIQIFGNDEEILKKVVIKLNNLNSVDIIDFNLGCPAPKIIKNGEGAALLKDINKVESVISAIMSVAKKPVTVKMRTGYMAKDVIAIDVARICEKYGVSAITVHGRSKEDYYFGEVNLEVIKKVKQSVKIPVIGNGDIVDIESAKNMFKHTGVDAIMIGRAAMRESLDL